MNNRDIYTTFQVSGCDIDGLLLRSSVRAKPDSKGEGEALPPLGVRVQRASTPWYRAKPQIEGASPKIGRSPISFPVISVRAVTAHDRESKEGIVQRPWSEGDVSLVLWLDWGRRKSVWGSQVQRPWSEGDVSLVLWLDCGGRRKSVWGTNYNFFVITYMAVPPELFVFHAHVFSFHCLYQVQCVYTQKC